MLQLNQVVIILSAKKLKCGLLEQWRSMLVRYGSQCDLYCSSSLLDLFTWWAINSPRRANLWIQTGTRWTIQ